MRVVHHFVRVGMAHGGVSRAIFDLVALLAREGSDVSLITSERSDFPPGWPPARSTVSPLPAPRAPFELYSRAALAAAAEAIRQADVLHLHGMWRAGNTQIAGLARRLGVPYVMTPHGMLDDWSMTQRPVRKRVFHRLFELRNLASAGRVHCTAEAEATQIRRWVPHERLTVIPCAFDAEPFAELPAPEVFLDRYPQAAGAGPVVLFLSRLHEKKGLEVLLEAAAQLRRKGLSFRLLVAGSGEPEYVESLRRLAERRSAPATFLGLVTGDEKLALYGVADVLALPTAQENFGLVFPEAMACETPVVTTRGTDIWPELESSGAARVVERTADAFAYALEALLVDREGRASMGRQGRRWVLDWLDPASVAGRYVQMYREAMAEASAEAATRC